MTMTENEIVRNYQQAKRKGQQIEILADLNQVSKDTIKAILRENRIDMRSANTGNRKPAIINKDFDDEINKMIEEFPVIEAADPVPGEVGYKEPEPEHEPIPDCINYVIELGMKQLDIQIAEKDKQLKDLMDEVEDLRCKRVQILSRINQWRVGYERSNNHN